MCALLCLVTDIPDKKKGHLCTLRIRLDLTVLVFETCNLHYTYKKWYKSSVTGFKSPLLSSTKFYLHTYVLDEYILVGL